MGNLRPRRGADPADNLVGPSEMLDEVSACKTAGAGDEDGRIERAAVHS
jgi:hypothetical protein